MINHDTDGHGHYGVVWKGPYAGTFPAHSDPFSSLVTNVTPLVGPYISGQMNVLDLLVAGVEFNWAR